MTKPTTTELNYSISFSSVDPEGTAPIRVVAGHARRVGETWTRLAAEMEQLADAFDRLISGELSVSDLTAAATTEGDPR